MTLIFIFHIQHDFEMNNLFRSHGNLNKWEVGKKVDFAKWWIYHGMGMLSTKMLGLFLNKEDIKI